MNHLIYSYSCLGCNFFPPTTVKSLSTEGTLNLFKFLSIAIFFYAICDEPSSVWDRTNKYQCTQKQESQQKQLKDKMVYRISQSMPTNRETDRKKKH